MNDFVLPTEAVLGGFADHAGNRISGLEVRFCKQDSFSENR
jgi:hypothetical protein